MSPLALTLMKFGLLALLYLFVWRALKSVASSLSARDQAPAPVSTGAPVRARAAVRKGADRTPTSVAIFTKDGRRVGSYRLTGDIEIGRSDQCTIRLTDTYASQVHARLSARNGAWVVEDLGSTNGTYLNDQRVESPSEVRAGDRVRIGTTTLEFRS
jgi:pSer/pThr/pTyr-binding forkhead associated (FHA) protein